MGLLDNKVAIVTGSGRGIGQGEALALAAEGALVIVNDIDDAAAKAVVAQIEAAGGQAEANDDDAASWQGAAALIEAAVSHKGQLDILVNNAGFLRDAMSFNMDEESWDDVIRVHLKGHFAPTRFAAQHWRERSKENGLATGGRVINTVSEAGLYGNTGQANYVAAKAGIAGMTIALARELDRYGVTVNAVAPRARTRMTEQLLGDMGKPPEAGFDEWSPANIAPTVVWLASDAAADVSGQVLIAFAGRIHLMQPWTMVSEIEQAERWDPTAIESRHAELFGDRGSGIPPFGFGR